MTPLAGSIRRTRLLSVSGDDHGAVGGDREPVRRGDLRVHGRPAVAAAARDAGPRDENGRTGASGETEDPRGRREVDVAVGRDRHGADSDVRLDDRRRASRSRRAGAACCRRSGTCCRTAWARSRTDRPADGTSTVTRPLCGSTRSTRPGLFSTSRSVPAGSSVDRRRLGEDHRLRRRGLDLHRAEPRGRAPRTRRQRPAARGREDETRPVRAARAGSANVDPLRTGRRDAHGALERSRAHGQLRRPGPTSNGSATPSRRARRERAPRPSREAPPRRPRGRRRGRACAGKRMHVPTEPRDRGLQRNLRSVGRRCPRLGAEQPGTMSRAPP